MWMKQNSQPEWTTLGVGCHCTIYNQLPPGECERLVMVTAGTTNGFIEGSYLCYSAESKMGDYRGEMNGKLFQQLLTTQLLPSLPSHQCPRWIMHHTTLTEES